MDEEQLLAVIATSPPQQLGRLLTDLLQAPVQTYAELCVVLPRLTFRLSRALFLPDEEPVAPLSAALEAALARFELDPSAETFVASGLPWVEQRRLTWLLGRLYALIVLTRQMPVLTLSAAARALIQEGSPGGRVLECVGLEEKVTQKALQAWLRVHPPALGWGNMTLRPLLLTLVREGLLSSDAVGAGVTYRLGPVGQRIVAERVEGLAGLEATYRAYRAQQGPPSNPRAALWYALFAQVDEDFAPRSSVPPRP